jgi:hypothetical protein
MAQFPERLSPSRPNVGGRHSKPVALADDDLVAHAPGSQVRMGKFHDELLIEVVTEGHRALRHERRSRSQVRVAELTLQKVNVLDVTTESRINKGERRPHADVVIAVRGGPPTSPP